MDHCANTIRIDLNEVTFDEAMSFVRQSESLYKKAIVYEEVADKTGKLHLQGWILFVSEKDAVNFKKNILRRWKKEHSLTASGASCAIVRKDSYYAYTAKDKKCVYSVGVSEEERIASEEKSYPKRERSVVDRVVAAFDKQRNMSPSKTECAEAVLEIYWMEKKDVFVPTVKAKAINVWLQMHGRRAVKALASEIFYGE